MRIGLDCDGVLAQWEPHARHLLKAEFGVDIQESTEWSSIQKSVTPEQWTWLWDEDGGLYDLFDPSMDEYPEGFEGVHALRKIGDVVIITSVPRVVIQDRLIWLLDHCSFNLLRKELLIHYSK